MTDTLRLLTGLINDLLYYQFPHWHADAQKVRACWHRAYEKAQTLPLELHMLGADSMACIAVLTFLVEIGKELSKEDAILLLSRMMQMRSWSHRSPVSVSGYLYTIQALESVLQRLETRIQALDGLRTRRFWYLEITPEMMRSEGGFVLDKMNEIRRWWLPLPFFSEIRRYFPQWKIHDQLLLVDCETILLTIFCYLKGPTTPSVYSLSLLLELFPRLYHNEAIQQVIGEVREKLRDPGEWGLILEDPESGEELISHQLIPHPDHFHWRIREPPSTWSGITRHFCLRDGAPVRCLVPQLVQRNPEPEPLVVGRPIERLSYARPTSKPESSWVSQALPFCAEVEFSPIQKRKKRTRHRASSFTTQKRRILRQGRRLVERTRSRQKRLSQFNKTQSVVMSEPVSRLSSR